ncbi:MAG: hypothetical protein RR744_07590 [Cellulosilyticaceae bacterium]
MSISGATTVAINNDQSLVGGIFSKFMDLVSQTNRGDFIYQNKKCI